MLLLTISVVYSITGPHRHYYDNPFHSRVTQEKCLEWRAVTKFFSVPMTYVHPKVTIGRADASAWYYFANPFPVFSLKGLPYGKWLLCLVVLSLKKTGLSCIT